MSYLAMPDDDDNSNQGGAPAAPRQVEQLPGGSLRVTTTPPAPAPTASRQPQQHGTFRSIAAGPVEHIERQSVMITTAPLAGSVVATARTNAGPASRCTDGCSVELPGGLRTDAATAAVLGYIVRNPDGSYRDAQALAPGATQGTAAQAAQEQQPEAGPDDAVIPDEEAIAFNQASEAIPDSIIDSATARVISAVASGDPAAWEGAAVELARGAGNGMDPGSAAAVIAAGYDVMERAVARAVGPMIGGTSEEARQAFYAWARENANPRDLEQACTQLAYEKKTGLWKQLASRYVRERSQQQGG